MEPELDREGKIKYRESLEIGSKVRSTGENLP